MCVALCVTVAAPTASSAAASQGHPWPTGDEWPPGLEGPFEEHSVERLVITSFDGTPLAGWLWRPDLPPGVRAPVVLWSGPYHAGLDAAGSDDDLRGLAAARERPVEVERLVAEGFAVAAMNVRGTGESGGCVDFFGGKEQRDQAVMVEWLAGREPDGDPSPAATWSNGRVGMVGLSYDGTTPWEAAIQDPPGLKAIVAMSGVGDYFLNYATPQGSMYVGSGAPTLANFGLNSAHPPLHRDPGHQPGALQQWARVAPQRFCDDVERQTTMSLLDPLADARDRAFYDERRLTDRFDRIRAATLFTAGFGDLTSLNQSIDTYGWDLLHAPKALVMGQWGHLEPHVPGWDARVREWFAFWLKGVGPSPRGLGTIEWAPGGGAECYEQWPCRTAQRWPPGRSEVLYALDGALTAEPAAAGPAKLHAVPRPGLDVTPCTGSTTSASFATPELEEAVTVAGSPFVLLDLRSDQTGGVLSARLYDLPPGPACNPAAVHMVAGGAADLRFHKGTFSGSDFPTDAATEVRIDLTNAAWTVKKGHRLALVVSGPVPESIITPNGITPYVPPTIEVLADGSKRASQIVLPLASGELGGRSPTILYPPRPFRPGPGPAAGRAEQRAVGG